MRLKTLRKERPAFENEGAVVSGSRMDIANNVLKPIKYRTNNTFAFPTSLNTELTFLNISSTNQTPQTTRNHTQQTLKRRAIPLSSPTDSTTNVSTYQAIEAAYLEHGIRIHLNSTNPTSTGAGIVVQEEDLIRKKPTNSLQRHTAFINRKPSRSSSELHYATHVQDTNQDSRPFSALHDTSIIDFEEINTPKEPSTQPTGIQNQLESSPLVHRNRSSSPIIPNQQIDYSKLANSNGKSSTATYINHDPDLAYMTSLLQTTNGDSFRNTIRRQAGLRPTLAVHRHPESAATTPNARYHQTKSTSHSPTLNRRSSIVRAATISVAPTPTTIRTTPTTRPSPRKLEKDILRHASRIRTSHIKETFLRQQNSLKFLLNEHTSSYTNRRQQNFQSTKSISLEPLELLLAPSSRPLSSSSIRTTSSGLYSSSTSKRNNNHQQNHVQSSKKSTLTISVVEDDYNTQQDIDEHLNSSFSNDESSPTDKTASLDTITNDGQIRQSNSFDSGCYDRSSSSGDLHSVVSLNIQQGTSPLISERLTSEGTRRSNTNKKVSFEDQFRPIIITTATYI